MAALEQEQLRVVLLDTKHRILGTRTVYQGSVNQAQVRVAEAMRNFPGSDFPGQGLRHLALHPRCRRGVHAAHHVRLTTHRIRRSTRARCGSVGTGTAAG
jgi:hypothetical protein